VTTHDVPFERTFREMFRRHAAGVAIITVNYKDQPYGFTATSVASLSAQPPRFTFNMARSSRSWPAVANTTYLGVHMLGLDNLQLADRFAGALDSPPSSSSWSLPSAEVRNWITARRSFRSMSSRPFLSAK